MNEIFRLLVDEVSESRVKVETWLLSDDESRDAAGVVYSRIDLAGYKDWQTFTAPPLERFSFFSKMAFFYLGALSQSSDAVMCAAQAKDPKAGAEWLSLAFLHREWAGRFRQRLAECKEFENVGRIMKEHEGFIKAVNAGHRAAKARRIPESKKLEEARAYQAFIDRRLAETSNLSKEQIIQECSKHFPESNRAKIYSRLALLKKSV